MKFDGNSIHTSLQLDNPASLNRFTRAIKQSCEDRLTLHLFEHRNSLVSVHGHTQTQLTKELLSSWTISISEIPGNPSIPTICLTPRMSHSLLNVALFKAGRKVCMWSVLEDGRPSLQASGSPANHEDLTKWIGESNIDETLLSSMSSSNSVLSLRIGRANGIPRIGVAVYDHDSRTLSTNDLYEDDSFSVLERILVAINVKEVICCEGDTEGIQAHKLADVCDQCQAALTILPRSQFSAADLSRDLERLLGNSVKAGSVLNNKLRSSACAATIGYVNLLSDPSLEGKVSADTLDTTGYMHLDSNAMRSLNIVPYPGDGGKNCSLLSLLNRTKSAVGSRLLRKWLTQPLQSEQAINERLDIVSTFVELPQLLESIRVDHISKMPDIEFVCRKFKMRKGVNSSLQDAVRLYQCSVRLPLLCECIANQSESALLRERYVKPLESLSKELANFEALVETTIDLDQVDNGEFVVSPSVSPELESLRRRQDKLISMIREEYNSVRAILSGIKGDGVKLERKDTLGYIFRITRREEKHIRGKSKFIVLETRRDGVRFQTSQLRRLSKEYEQTAEQYTEVEREMRIKTLDVAATYVEVFSDVAAVLGEMDILATFAFIATNSRSRYVRPKIKPPGSGLVVKQGRHPIVEENMADNESFIPNDIDLTRPKDMADSQKDGKGGRFLVVTGPNMGGKSTYIRSAGVFTVLAHIGSYIPAEEAEVPITDRIFTRVGAGDNQHRAISTFMSEMLETAAILRSASCESLIIIDELGRGTGTTEGYGLAHAISKHIASEIKAACLFATHFFELTELPEQVPIAQNVHVTATTCARTNKLTFLYEVAQGGCDQSFGVHVAEMANFPPQVIDRARRKADELEGHMSESKRRKIRKISEEEKDNGHSEVQDFVTRIRSLLTNPAQVGLDHMKEAQTAYKALLSSKNEYVQSLISSLS